MKKEFYQKMASAVRKKPYGVYLVRWMDRLIVITTAMAYLILLGYLWKTGDFDRLYHALLVPAAGFVGISLFRRFWNAPRPYEEMELTPLIQKKTRGKSFPSRHVFSVFIIGMTFVPFNGELAAGLFLMGAVLAALRVVAGLHYVRDVIAAIVMAVFIGGAGIWFFG